MDKKNILTKIKELFTTEEEVLKFVDVKIQDGTILRITDMVVGSEVKELTEDGEGPIEDGEYVIVEPREGLVIVVSEGKIDEIKEVEVEEEEVEEEVIDATEEEKEDEMEKDKEEPKMFMDLLLEDGTKIHVVTKVEGELSEGDEVHVVGENDEMLQAPSGEHKLDDGRVIVVDESGYLVEVREEVKEEEEEMSEVDEDVWKPTDVVDIIQDITGEDLVDEEETTPTKVTGILKDLISQIKELKNSFEEVKKENEELKSRFNKFANEPSEEPIKEKISFNKVSKEDKLKFFSKR